jgi:hypothetical protein
MLMGIREMKLCMKPVRRRSCARDSLLPSHPVESFDDSCSQDPPLWTLVQANNGVSPLHLHSVAHKELVNEE